MFIALVTISILVIAGALWLLNRILPFQICPICAGVSGTWLWMFAARSLGYEIDLIILAMLMGGSIVGIAYLIEKHLPSNRSPILWKTLFIPAGFVAVYCLVSLWWTASIVIITVLILMALLFSSGPRARMAKGDNATVVSLEQPSPHEMRREELKKKMESCC